ncbi:related to phytochrome [Rhynchosporium agropyri]|uniref:Related to phytochrome n=1 Tax=Rhynchosporium agropyri TaxID=914238 RepID=A0A1E1LAI8_9HELO|nr:related to phytochrome [Rhynchosporium agropyri]
MKLSGEGLSDSAALRKEIPSSLATNIPTPGIDESPSRVQSGSSQTPPATEHTTEHGQGKPRLAASDVRRSYFPVPATDGTSSWSTSSERQLASPGSATGDRVYPIRSVVSVDSSQTPYILPGRKSSEHQSYFPPGATGVDIATRVGSQHQHRQSISEDEQSKQSRRSSREAGYRKDSTSNTHSDADRLDRARMQIFSDATSDKSNEKSNVGSLPGTYKRTKSSVGNASDVDSLSGLMTARFKHVITAEGHAVITGRDGETLQRCEDEPIHIPGAIQSFGLLIALEELEEGELLVRVVSENSLRIIGYTPQELFKLKSFTDILSEEQTDNVLDHVDFIRDDEADPATNGPEVFTVSIRSPLGTRKNQKLWCAMHINPANSDLIICEFELDDDQMHPLVPPNDKTPEPPEDTLDSHPTKEEYDESTHISSKPLRILRSARKRKGEAAAMEVFNIMSQVQEQLATASNLDTFLKVLVGVVKELTGFHRVMIYQFDNTFNGRVVTELVDPRATKDLYKGASFGLLTIAHSMAGPTVTRATLQTPLTCFAMPDIYQGQARDMYKVNKVRLLYDRDLETARLVCREVQDLETPLDLTFSYLRAMSPIHIKYLTNMAVRSSMSISINAFGELWGLIACHTYGSKGMRVSFPIRKMCRLVGDTASRNIEKLSYASRLQARKLINTVPTETNPSGFIIASSEDLLNLFDADFGLLSIRGETKIMGQVDQTQEALAMLEYLRLRKFTSVITSQDIRTDFPDLLYAPGFDVIAGLLLVPLSVGGSDFIVFFRRGQAKEVKWAGNPYEKFLAEGTEGYLEPRKSFKVWSETVVGKCREWTEEHVETAAVLCLVYGKFIEVWRQKEVAMQNSQLTKLLLANSAHEVRTPLNAIINYLEIALEGSLDQETRDNLSKSHSASKSLIYVINDLLDLTNTEEGQALIKDEVFDLPATIREATDSFTGDAKRKGLVYEVIEYPGVPKLVLGDQRRVRMLVANIMANAVQQTTEGSIRVEIWLHHITEDCATIEIVVQDTGVGMSNATLDSLFRDLEQVSTEGEDGQPFNDQSESSRAILQGRETKTLGLGLAMVARTIRNMDGQLRLKSEEGKGSRFVMQLPFSLPDNANSEMGTSDIEKTSTPTSGSLQPVAPDTKGEVTLVKKLSSLNLDQSVTRRRSLEEPSLRSFRSGSSAKSNKSDGSKKSDVDRLIDAISGPLDIGEAESEEQTLQRSASKGSGHSRRSSASVGSVQNRLTDSHQRPGQLSRSTSYGAPEHLRSIHEGPAGSEFVTDSKTLLRAIRMPEESDSPATPQRSSKVLFEIPDKGNPEELGEQNTAPGKQDAEHLQVLVAEDDPVNSRIIRKRLEKSGHQVHHTINGEDCASVYGDHPAFFDVLLMDMQMPIVDGLTSTKMIRSYEKSHPESKFSSRAMRNGRVPIFAVSASLLERDRQTYINAGFDGWILKPINFSRLNILLSGIVDDRARNSCLYKPGGWEQGGWFQRRGSTSPLQIPTAPTSQKSASEYDGNRDKASSHNSSESGSITPTEMRRPLIHDERLDIPEVVKEETPNEHDTPRSPVQSDGKSDAES